MRTTLDIDEDVLEIAKAMSVRERVSIGAALSMMAREAVNRPVGIRYEGSIPVFDIPEGSSKITNEMVRDALSDA